MESGFLDRIYRLFVETNCMGIGFSDDIGCYRALELRLSELFERGVTEESVLERGSSETDQGVLVCSLEPLLIGLGNPQIGSSSCVFLGSDK